MDKSCHSCEAALLCVTESRPPGHLICTECRRKFVPVMFGKDVFLQSCRPADIDTDKVRACELCFLIEYQKNVTAGNCPIFCGACRDALDEGQRQLLITSGALR